MAEAFLVDFLRTTYDQRFKNTHIHFLKTTTVPHQCSSRPVQKAVRKENPKTKALFSIERTNKKLSKGFTYTVCLQGNPQSQHNPTYFSYIYSVQYKHSTSITHDRPFSNFPPKSLSCDVLAMATAGFPIESICREIHDCWSSDNKRRVIQVLVGISQSECRKVQETYLKVYGEDLIETCGGKFDSRLSFLASLMLNPFDRDAAIANEAICRNDCVNYEALIEIFACRKSSHVLLIMQAYQGRYRRQLDMDIAGIEPSHPHQKMLMALSASHKAHHADISQHIAKCDARRLYQTGEGRQPGAIDEAVVLEILSKRSIEQLKLAFLSYKHIYGHSYTSFLQNGGSGDFEDALKLLVECICNPPRYYAKVLRRSLEGANKAADYRAIARVMVSRAEVELDEIQRSFRKKYGVELKTAICESFGDGDHREFLLTLAAKSSSTC